MQMRRRSPGLPRSFSSTAATEGVSKTFIGTLWTRVRGSWPPSPRMANGLRPIPCRWAEIGIGIGIGMIMIIVPVIVIAIVLVIAIAIVLVIVIAIVLVIAMAIPCR